MFAQFFLTVMLTCVPAADEHPQTLLYLSDSGPIVIELHVTVDGESHRSAWKNFARDLFNDLDLNSSGALEGDETGKIPTPAQIRQMGLSPRGSRPAAVDADSNPRDGQVTQEEFADYLESVAGDPFQVSISQPPQPERFRRPSTTASGDSGLFEQLDTDHDKMLAAGEFSLTRALLKHDLDDDGTISREEIQPLQSQLYAVQQLPRETAPQQVSPFIHIDGAGSPSRLVQRIIQRYDRGEKDGRLSVEELGGGTPISTLDLDGNQQIDFDELRILTKGGAPDLVVHVRLGGNRQGAPLVEVKSAPETRERGDVRNDPAGMSAVVAFDKTQLEFIATGGAWAAAEGSIYERQFSSIDSDNNGYLEEKEVEGNRALKEAFPLIDRDSDEKVFKKEFVKYFERLSSAARARTVLTVTDEGNRLFDILDKNRDGRLSPRELSAGRAKIAAWDENGDEQVANAEIPRTWRLSASRGNARLGGVTFVAASPTPTYNSRIGQQRGPAWFVQMDRNADGEVARREFLGKLADFDRLDADGNDVLDPDEADAKK